MKTNIGNPKFRAAQAHFEAECKASREHIALIRKALADHGDGNGVQISGIGRDHFPAEIKDQLRLLAQMVRTYGDLAQAARPSRVRQATMNRLAQDIATRDGSGFYGPQPRRG